MGILIGPPIGGLLPPIIASYVAIACVLGSLLYVIVVLEESLSERSRLEVRQHRFLLPCPPSPPSPPSLLGLLPLPPSPPILLQVPCPPCAPFPSPLSLFPPFPGPLSQDRTQRKCPPSGEYALLVHTILSLRVQENLRAASETHTCPSCCVVNAAVLHQLHDLRVMDAANSMLLSTFVILHLCKTLSIDAAGTRKTPEQFQNLWSMQLYISICLISESQS